MEAPLLVLAGAAVVLILLIARNRTRTESEESPTNPRADVEDPAAVQPPQPDSSPRVPLTRSALPPEPAPTEPTPDLDDPESLIDRTCATGACDDAVEGEEPGRVTFWSLVAGSDSPRCSPEGPAGPECFAVNGLPATRVLEMVRGELIEQGFAVQTESSEHVVAHRGAVVLHTTVRAFRTGLSRDEDGALWGSPSDSVIVEIDTNPAEIS